MHMVEQTMRTAVGQTQQTLPNRLDGASAWNTEVKQQLAQALAEADQQPAETEPVEAMAAADDVVQEPQATLPVDEEDALPESAPKWEKNLVAKLRADRREARQELEALKLQMAELTGRLSAVSQPQAEVKPEESPTAYHFGPMPENWGAMTPEEQWNVLTERAAGLSRGTADIATTKAEQRIAALEAQLQQYGATIGNVEVREAKRELDGAFAAAKAQFPVLKDPTVFELLTNDLHQKFGGQPLNMVEIQKHIAQRASALQKHIAPRPVQQNPAAAPIAGSRQSAPGNPAFPRNDKFSWDAYVKPLAYATIKDILPR